MISIKRIFTIIGLSLVVLVLAVVGFTTWYTVDESEQAVILTFGDAGEPQVEPGLKFKLPWPIQTVEILSKETFSLQFGYEEQNGQIVEYPEETKMITGDENIVLADLVVQWKITDPARYLYNSEDPKVLLHNATSASLRSIIGSTKIDDALTSGKAQIEADVRDLLTTLADKYDIGISILSVKLQDVELPNEDVRKAFTNVTDARETMNTKINEANKYRNKRTQEAEGEKDAIISKAEGDKAARIEIARGDVAIFTSLYNEYKGSPAITRERLVLETLDQVLPGTQIYIMKDEGNTMKYFPIQPVQGQTQTQIPPVTPEGSEKND